LAGGARGADGGAGFGAAVDGYVRFDSDVRLNSSDFLVPSGSRILLTEAALSDIAIGSFGNRSMYFEGQGSNQPLTCNLFTQTGDGGDSVWHRVWAKGTLDSQTDSESLLVGYSGSEVAMLIWSLASGTGTVRPIKIYTGVNTNQLVCAIDGKVGIGLASPKTKLTIEGALTLKEQVAADGDNAGYGQIWVKSDTPCSLYFTDDTGVDTKLNLVIGTDIQAHSAALDDLTNVGIVTGDSYFLVGTGVGTLAWESGTTVRTSIGLGTADIATFAGLSLPNTTTSTTGVIRKDNIRFLHNFQHPTGDTAVPTGQNVFLGRYAGNFTMGSEATSTSHASFNVGVGPYALFSNTLGHHNMAIGEDALFHNTTGNWNACIGASAGVDNTTGYENTFIGGTAGFYNTTGYRNVAIGQGALSSIVETVHRSVYIGAYTVASADGVDNENVIGYNATGVGSNTVRLGNTNILQVRMNGSLMIAEQAAAIADVAGFEGTDHQIAFV